MSFRNFRFNIVLRLFIIIATVLLLLSTVKMQEYVISSIILALVTVWQVYALILYVERTNRKLTTFLDSIKHSDFASNFSDHGLGKSFDDLNRAFNEVINEFKKTRASKEEHYNYLQTLVQHISIGILVFHRDGKVDVFNNAAKTMLRINSIRFVTDLVRVDKQLADTLMKMKAGDSNLVKIFVENELLQLSIRATEFRMRGDDFVLVSLQNIHGELEAKEMDSWQKLIRVLTHEIMNSITPIVSLSSTVKEVLIDEENTQLRSEIDQDDVETVQSALSTIERRSQGLLNFVQIYRNLTRIPKPNFRINKVNDLISPAIQLLQPKLKELGVDVQIRVIPKDLKITADPDLIDQVLINLIINSIHALKEIQAPVLKITALTTSNNRVRLTVSDNGHGIKPDNMEQIFVPFFTSKKEGSGIGLSLSREIMRLHKGNITVRSKPFVETSFTLYF